MSESAQELAVGPEAPPTPVGLERAWHNLMVVFARKNAGYAVGANQARKHLHGLMARNGWKGIR